MTYNVFGGTLNLALFIYLSICIFISYVHSDLLSFDCNDYCVE